MNKRELMKLIVISYICLILITCVALSVHLYIFYFYLQYVEQKMVDIYYNKIIISDSIDFVETMCKYAETPKVLPTKSDKLFELFNDTKIIDILH